MGIAAPIEESGRQHHQKPTMKAFIAVCAIAASATAEADPALVYTTGHTVVPHVVAPAVYTHGGLVAHPNGAVTPDYTPAQKVAAATHLAAKVHTPVYSGIYSPYIHYGKREPEARPAAEAQADSWGYGYGLPYAYEGVYSPYIHYGKRDAEAKSDAWGYGLGGVYGYPHVYGSVYGAYPYHYGKRDAEAKGGAWGYGLGGIYGYPNVYGGVYGGYPYHYGKRDAEAKSDAYLYGGYGYPYGGVHTYGFPYGGYLG